MKTAKILSFTTLVAMVMGACAVSLAEEVKDSTSTEIVSVEDSDIRNEDALRVAIGDFDDVEFLLSAEEMATIANNADVSLNDISAQGHERSGSSMFSAEASERVEATQSTSSTFNGALILAPATSETVTVRQSAVATMSLIFDNSTEQYATDAGKSYYEQVSTSDSVVSKETGAISFLGNFDSVGYTDGSYGISTLSVGGVTLADSATYTWTGNGADSSWTTAGNWDLNTEWVEGSNADFPYYSGDDNITNTEVTISGAIVAGTVTIGDEYTFTLEEGASLSMDLQPNETHDPHLTIAGEGTVTITGSSFSLKGLLTIAGSEVTFNDISLNGGTLEVTGGKVIFDQNTTNISGDGTIDISTGDAEFTGIVNIGGAISKGAISIGTEGGTGGTVTFGGQVNIGYSLGGSSEGVLTIMGGTVTFGGVVSVGANANCKGELTISGGTNTFSGSVNLGYASNSTGLLTISGGTNSFSSSVTIGFTSNSPGTLTISGGENTFSGSVNVGSAGGGTATISGGTTYFKAGVFIHSSSTSNADSMEISGEGTNVTFGASSGSSATSVYVGYSSGATGTLTISGGTVKFGATGGSAATNVYVGYVSSATGIIEITGGTVTFGNSSSSSRKTNVYIGGWNTSATTGDGTITISGSGTKVTFDTYSVLDVGYYGIGKLEIKDDADVSFNGDLNVAYGSASVGTMTISTGKDSKFAGDVVVGVSGTGTLEITGGSNTFSKTLYIGSGSGSSGEVTISGTENGSEKNTFTGQVRIGNNGTGSLTLENATNTFSAAVYLGYNSSGSGTLTLTSGDTTFSSTVTVGNSGTGKLDITGGTATFSGAVTVGNSGTGELDISGGTATFNGNLTVKTNSSFSVGSGAQATIAKVKVDLASAISNSGTIYLDDGVTFVLNDSLITDTDDTSTTYTLISGGGTIIVGDSSEWSDLTINNFLDSSGSAINLGRSQLILDTAGVVTIYSGSTDLIWTGKTSTAWVNNQETVINWKMEDDSDTYFINGDNVTFDSTADTDKRTVSIGEEIVAGTVTVNGAAYTWTFSDEGGSVTADSLTLNGEGASLTITGNGEFDLGNTSDQSLAGAGSITVSDGATLKLVEGGDDEYEDENITITVGSGGTLDVDGDGGTMFKLVLDGGTLTSSADVLETKKQLPDIKLTANSTVDATNNLGMIGSGYSETRLDLNGKTLTKTGTGNFFLYNTTVTAGTIDVTAGTLELYGTDASAATVVVAEGATLYVGNNNGSYSKVGSLTSSGTVDLKAGSTLEITGNSTISGSLSLETSGGNSSTLKVTGGANLTLNVSSVLVGSGSTLSIGDSSSLTLNTSLAFHDSSSNASGTVAFSTSASLIINQSVFDGVTVEEGEEVSVAIISANTITFGDVELSYSGTLEAFTSNNITVDTGQLILTGWSYENGTLYAIVTIPEPELFSIFFGLGAIGLVATRRRRRVA